MSYPNMTNLYSNQSTILNNGATAGRTGGAYQCNECSNNYRDGSALKRHQNEKHMDKEKRRCMEYQQKEHCSYATNRPYDMRRHLQRHQKEGGIKHSRYSGTGLSNVDLANGTMLKQDMESLQYQGATKASISDSNNGLVQAGQIGNPNQLQSQNQSLAQNSTPGNTIPE